MAEEAKQEQGPPAEEKKEEKGEEKKEEKAEEKKEEGGEKKQEEEAKPPSPFVLYVDLHCVGCAKKIERSIMKLRGVEEVVMDMVQNQVTIKGVVEPQAVCMRIRKKTKRTAKVLSPLPATEGEPMPDVISSQVSGLATVELNVNMHCEACAAQLKRKILKMRGVRTAETELSSGKVTVTGTMNAERLVDYVYRRTKKQARIVPQPEPAVAPPETKDNNDEDQNKPAPKEAAAAEANKPPPEEKKEENAPAAAEAEKKEENKEGGGGGGDEAKKEQKKEGGGDEGKAGGDNEEQKQEAKGGDNGEQMNIVNVEAEESMKMMMYNYYPPLYVMERIPPPQLFSDENPNACSIS
ncbi:heavy metal-associated isoprenylated plant protein 9 isoform X2 [Malania oleifera]|uniref:heavy metal-associated isoprenylated plant protein 9 isoform X2 n=1 Tax=Malania oleifera TaxID=397392 RepID=UPI0025AEC535|nr:heavy metal-associated isoprenylated plant protein 9 isoform X2 [Malania oleifera]